MKFSSLRRGAFTVTLLALFSTVAFTQGIITGSVSGTVEDASGAVLPGALITAKNLTKGFTFTATSSSSGEFNFSTLPVGEYTISITSSGFNELKLDHVLVETGKGTGLGIEKMQTGGAAVTVEISTAQNLLETVQSQVTTTFDSQQIQNLPTGGGFDELALLIPGNVSVHGNNRSNTNGASISSNGQRGRNNNFELDGQSNNDNSVAGPQVFMSNPDAIQEIQIVTNNFSAQYGRDAGTVVNYVTKSGTNAIHGSALYFYEGAWLSSLTNGQKNPVFGYCAPGQVSTTAATCTTPYKPRFTDNDFGGTLGGPILKDKLFAFGSAYFARNFSGQTTSNTTTYFPTPTSISTLQSAYPGNPGVASLIAYNPFAVTLGNPVPINAAAVKVATVTDGTTATTINLQQYSRTISSYSTDKEILGRLDYQATPKDRFFTRFFYQLNPSIAGSGTVSTGGFVNVSDITYSVGADWTHTFTGSLVNQIRYSFQQATIKFDGGGFSGCTISSLNSCPSNFSLGTQVTTAGNVSLSGFGLGTSYPQGRIVKDSQYQDNLTWTKGKHAITIGGAYEFQNSPNVFLPNISGSFSFSGISALLQGTGTLSLAAGNANIHFEENDVALYAQDDWRITPTLTLNLGLRWEFFGQPINLLNEISVANQTSSTPIWSTALPTSATEFPHVNEYYKNFEPRIGFAWHPSFSPKAVLRGGYAINVSPAYYNIALNSYGSAPVLVSASIGSTSNASKPVLPSGGANYTSVHAFDNHYLLGNGLNPGSFNQTLVAPNFKQPKTQTYTLGAQYQFGRYVVAEARYVGSHTAGDFQSVNANPNIGAAVKQFPSFFPGVSYCTDSTQIGYNHVSCAATNVRSRLNTAFEIYNGLQTSLTTRSYRGITATLGYTWSRTIDNASEVFGTAGAGTTVAFSQNPLDTNHGERGVSGNSYPNATSLGLTYVVPLYQRQHNLKATLLGGFQLNTIYLFNSGQPYTPEQYYTEGSYCDIAFGTAFIGNQDACRPILGNPAANFHAVGVNVGNGVYQDYTTGAVGARSSYHWLVNNQAEAKAIGNPYPGVGRNTLRGSTFNNADMSIFKNNKFGERYNLQLQLTVFNALNRQFFGVQDPEIENEATSFNNYAYGSGSNRNVQIGGKIQF